jgi:hypothetical protein
MGLMVGKVSGIFFGDFLKGVRDREFVGGWIGFERLAPRIRDLKF